MVSEAGFQSRDIRIVQMEVKKLAVFLYLVYRENYYLYIYFTSCRFAARTSPLVYVFHASAVATVTPSPQRTPPSILKENRTLVMSESWLQGWLTNLNLPEYQETFSRYGYHSAEGLAMLDREQLKAIGITKMGHLSRLLRAIEKIRSDSAGGGVEGDEANPSSTSSPLPVENMGSRQSSGSSLVNSAFQVESPSTLAGVLVIIVPPPPKMRDTFGTQNKCPD